MSVVQKLIDHFEGLPGGHIEVPEWGLTIYWKPPTLIERSTINRLADGDNFKLLALVLERRALDDQGNRVFENGDVIKMMRKADSSVIVRVAEIMMAAPSFEDAEKN